MHASTNMHTRTHTKILANVRRSREHVFCVCACVSEHMTSNGQIVWLYDGDHGLGAGIGVLA